MKPDWKDAPDWAQWLAMDSDGVWYWYETEPEKQLMGAWYLSRAEGRMEEAVLTDSSWDKTLEPRP